MLLHHGVALCITDLLTMVAVITSLINTHISGSPLVHALTVCNAVGFVIGTLNATLYMHRCAVRLVQHQSCMCIAFDITDAMQVLSMEQLQRLPWMR
jgi:hypothetical protein